MRPISDINIGDQYQRNYPFQNLYSVQDINKEERMIKLQAYSSNGREILKPFWKYSNDDIFNKRIFNGVTNKMEMDLVYEH